MSYGEGYSIFGLTTSESPTLFGRVQEQRVVFCIDTSGSMYGCLDAVKDHLIEVLQHRAAASDESLFNIIEFSTDVVQWSDEMVKCTPETVSVAKQWIQDLHAKTGTNTRDALLTALSDADCDAVYLVTDSIPDQHADDVIDDVVHASRNRPVHCFYMQGGSPDPAATEFLRTLAMETYGSFHLITVSHHGAIERIAPIYRAEGLGEGVVRTTSGSIFPANQKLCSVSTTLNAAGPDVISYPIGLAPGLPYNLVVPPFPYSLYPWPYRYYYSLLPPYGGWSRYRPAKAWLKHAHDFIDNVITVCPGAGSMLIGAKVLARRHADGLFYLGTVKSQIVNNKFLVEFGPCKHGKFKDTEYQETFVYDIISHADALRHPVLVDDKVLAPWEPEGERYAPGIVIDGQEKRMADGGGPDKALVITFHDGKTVTVPRERAIWLPHDLHERITFELTLPRNVRREFASHDFYPEQTIIGYPPSGPLAYPPEFDRYIPPGWMSNDRRGENGYPMFTHPKSWFQGASRTSITKPADEIDQVIPGTDMTKSQLNSKVMSQIMQNKMMLEGKSETTPVEDRLLKKREALEENSLKKSVSFVDPKTDLETKLDGADDNKDSGRGSQTDLYFTDDDDFDLDNKELVTARDPSSDTKLFHRRRSQRSQSPSRQQWKYWKNDPAPSVMEPLHYGPYRYGAYRDCMEQPSILLRDAKKSSYNAVEWTSPMGQVVDTYAKYKCRQTVEDCLHMPRPPSSKPPRQGPGHDISEVLGTHQQPAERLADQRRDFRQRQVLEREIGWLKRNADVEKSQQLACDYRRQQVQLQLERQQNRQQESQSITDRHLDAKRYIKQQLNERFKDNVDKLGLREAQILAAKANQKVSRNIEAAERNYEVQLTRATRQAAREMQGMARAETMGSRIAEQEQQLVMQHNQRVRTQAGYNAHFRHVENENQKRKELSGQVRDQAQAILRSQVLP